jgi:hypothetical protein
VDGGIGQRRLDLSITPVRGKLLGLPGKRETRTADRLCARLHRTRQEIEGNGFRHLARHRGRHVRVLR